MAENQENLLNSLEILLSQLSSSEIPTEQIFIQAQQYGFLRARLSESATGLARARAESPAAYRSLLRVVLFNVYRDAQKSALGSEPKDRQLTPEQSAKLAEHWARAEKIIEEKVDPQVKTRNTKAAALSSSSIVNAWIKQIRNPSAEAYLKNNFAFIDSEVRAMLIRGYKANEIQQQILNTLGNYPEIKASGAETVGALRNVLDSEYNNINEVAQLNTQVYYTREAIAKTVIANADKIVEVDRLAEIVSAKIDERRPLKDIEKESLQLTRIAEAYDAGAQSNFEGPIFQSLYPKNPLSPLADALFASTLFFAGDKNKELRASIVGGLLSRPVNLAAMQGKNIPGAFFKWASDNTNKGWVPTDSRAKGWIGAFRAVFPSAVDTKIFLENVRLSFAYTTVTTPQVVAAATYGQFGSVASFGLDSLGNFAFSWLKSAGGKALSGAGTKAASRIAGTAISGGTLAIPLGISAAWDVLKGLFASGGTRSSKSEEKLVLYIIVGAIVVVIVCFGAFAFIPGLNFLSTQQMALTSSLAVGAAASGPSIDCATRPEDPLCKYDACKGDCKWPTTGYITQGSNITCNPKATHFGVNAIDIGAAYLTPVYATRPGTIQTAFFGCNDTTGGASQSPTCGGNGGNHVILRTDDGVTLWFGHLSKNKPPGIVEGAHVDATTQIGKVDNNGNSTGNHLHFGVVSGPNINNLLPADYIKANGQIQNCVIQTAGCQACSSFPPVSASQ